MAVRRGCSRPIGEPKNAAILADGMQMATDSGSFHTVLTRTIDSLATELGGLDVIKIDAEGAEEGIFEGMAEAIRQYRPAIVLEFNAARYRDPRDFLGRMKRAYGALHFIDNAGKPKTVSEGEVLTRNFGEDWLLFLARGMTPNPARRAFLPQDRIATRLGGAMRGLRPYR